MNDGPEAREALRAAIEDASPDVRALRLVRFRGATLGSIAGDVLEAIGDSFGNDEHVGDGPDRRPAGLSVDAYRADGTHAGRLTVHPASPDLEGWVLGLADAARRRSGVVVELWAEDVALERFEAEIAGGPRRAGGYRDAPLDLASPFSGTDAVVERRGDTTHVVHEQQVHTAAWQLPLVVLFLVIFWWAALPALLFAEGRAFVLGLVRSATRKAPVRFEASFASDHVWMRGSDQSELRLQFRDVRLVSLASPRWTGKEVRQSRRELRALTDRGFVELGVPPSIREAFAETLRRAIGPR